MNRFRRSRTGTPVSGGGPTGPTLVDLGITSVNWDLNAPAGAVLATFTGKAAGSAVTITPNDGRMVMSSDSTQILRGLSAWTAGDISIQPTEANATSPISPHVTPPITVHVAAVVVSATDVWPSGTFVGTDDTSGFGAGNPFTATSGSVSEPTPSSPRIVASAPKPMCCYHEDPREAMTADYPVTISAVAKGGIAKVRLIVGGNFADQTTPGPRTRAEWDGANHVEWGYQFNLKHASFPASGWTRIYAIAFPVDNTMLPRVIGPFLIRRKVGSYYDAVINVRASPGAGEYANTPTGFNQAVNAAGVMLKSVGAGGQGYEHVKIAIKNSFTYDVINTLNLFNTYTNKGHLDVICDAGINLLVNKANEGTLPFGLDVQGTRWGPGVRIDMHYISVLFAAYAGTNNQTTDRKAISLIGCEIFDSGGRFNKTGWYGYENCLSPKGDGPVSQGMRMMGVNWHDMYVGPKAYTLIRNSTASGISQDALNPPDMAVAGLQYALIYGLRLTDFDLSYWDTTTPSISFVNNSGATITLDIDDTTPNHEGARQLIWKRNGTTITGTPVSGVAGAGPDIGTVNGGQGQIGSTWTPPSGAYLPSDYVTAFNAKAAADAPGVGLNGVSATLQGGAANTIPMGFAGNAPSEWTGTKTITTTPYVLPTRFDVHGDLFQPQGSSPENILIVCSDFQMRSGQGWFLDWGNARDIGFINTVVSYYGARQVGHNSIGSPVSHVLMLHSDVLDDDFLMAGFTPDAYSSISNNIFQQSSGSAGNLIEMDHNVYVENSAQPGGTGNTNSTVLNRGSPGTGNTNSTDLFVDYINRDYRPAAPILAHMAPRRAEVPFDINGLARGTSVTAPGAAVAAAGG